MCLSLYHYFPALQLWYEREEGCNEPKELRGHKHECEGRIYEGHRYEYEYKKRKRRSFLGDLFDIA